MTRQDAFLRSAALYAVNLSGMLVSDPMPRQRRDAATGVWTDDPSAAPFFRCEIPAVWYRRRKGVDTANVGALHAYVDNRPADPQDFMLHGLSDGRHGPSCRARWDGERFWHDPALPQGQAERDLAFLKAMLVGISAIPEGFDGWWRFEKRAGR